MATPIITCGNSKPDATGVHKGMKPEYEVIYAGFSLPETLEELPQILSGNPPKPSSLHSQVASNSFNQHPRAIVVGGGYQDNDYQKLYQACLDACGGNKENMKAAWFRADNEITDRLYNEGKGPQKHAEGYPQAIAKRLKDKLRDVGVKDGLKGEDVGELFRY